MRDPIPPQGLEETSHHEQDPGLCCRVSQVRRWWGSTGAVFWAGGARVAREGRKVALEGARQRMTLPVTERVSRRANA